MKMPKRKLHFNLFHGHPDSLLRFSYIFKASKFAIFTTHCVFACCSAADQAWRLLQSYLSKYEDRSTRYHRCVAVKLLTHNFQLPDWFIASYKVQITSFSRAVCERVQKRVLVAAILNFQFWAETVEMPSRSPQFLKSAYRKTPLVQMFMLLSRSADVRQHMSHMRPTNLYC